MMDFEQIEEAVRKRFPAAVEDAQDVFGVPTLYIQQSTLVDICKFLKDDPSLRMDYLVSLTAVDWLDRFDVVYHLSSLEHKHYITLKVKVDRHNPAIASVAHIWRAADWQEREVYDMFGIKFEEHPNLRRILLDESWEGFPLRKDYTEA